MPDAVREPPERGKDARRRAMEAVADESGGTLVEGRMTGRHAVDVGHGPWTLRLGLHMVNNGSTSTMHTRVLGHFASREDFKLLIRRRTFLDGIARRLGFGGHDLVGRELAERYVVRGRPLTRVRSVMSGGLGDALLRSGALRVVISRASFRQRRKWGPRTQTLQVLRPGQGTDGTQMLELLEVARAAMDVLERVGIALPSEARGTRNPD